MKTRTILLIAAVLLATIAVLAVEAQRKELSSKDRKKVKCGVCHVVLRNLGNVRENARGIINQGPYSMETEVLIDEAITHVCGVSMDSFKTMGFEDYLVHEECTDLVYRYSEELEDLMREGNIDFTKACLKTIPVCKGIDPTLIPQPTVTLQNPKVKMVPEDEAKEDL